MTDEPNVFHKLMLIQTTLKVPKSQRNTFGNYNYRNCEDILEAVKPLLKEHGLLLALSDEIVQLGDRYYVKATASVGDGNTLLEASAYAREAETKRGMDEAQITGAASSYARKYALNGLFGIDDTKDADSQDNSGKTDEKPTKSDEKPPTEAQLNQIRDLAAKKGIDADLTEARIKEISTSKEAWAAIKKLGE